MFQKLINVELLNQNAMRSYPLSDEVTERDTTGGFILPRDLLVDFSMPLDVNLDVDTTLFYVSEVAVYGTGVTITVRHSTSGVVGSVAVASSSHTINKTYYLPGQGVFDGMMGKVTIGDIGQTLAAAGVYAFALTDTRVLPQLFQFDVRGVTSLRVLNGTEDSGPVYGTLDLANGRNVRLRVEDTDPDDFPDDPTRKTIYIDALMREGLNEECGCEGEVTPPPFIRTINDVPPLADGSFFLLGDACIKFDETGSAGALQVRDECSQPCCSSRELQVIEDDLNGLNLDVRTQRAFMDRIEAHLIAMDGLRQTMQQILNTTCP